MSELEKCKECGNKEIYQDNLCFKCFGKKLFSGLGEKSKEQQLQDRIDKAIEYIDRRDIEWGSEEHNKLLSILKGSDKVE